MRLRVDYDLCQGHGMCVLEAPEVFALDRGDDQVRLLAAEPGDDQHEAARRAVRYCPNAALSVDD